MDLKPGDRLSDNLELEREIGSGGMGAVWVARNEALGSRVAVKVLQRLGGAKGAQQRARFEQEAKVVARLDHPNIVKVFDLGVTMDGDPFIVMELLKGEDLGERVRRGRLSVADTRAIVAQACGALSCAHAAGIVHRDIKPANVFLVEGASAVFVKVVDFGVAKLATGSLDMTKTGEMIGTPFYMSPEQFLRPKEIDARSDLWSLGVVAYACLTGSLPFTGDTLTAVGMAVATGKFDAPRSHRSDLPGALDHFMQRALSTDPSKRYGTAMEFAAAFERATASAPVSVPAPSAPTGSAPSPSLPYASTMREADKTSSGPPAPPRQHAGAPGGFDPTNPPLATLASAGGKRTSSALKWGLAVGGVAVVVLAAVLTTYFVMASNRQAGSATSNTTAASARSAEPGSAASTAAKSTATKSSGFPIAGMPFETLLQKANEEAQRTSKNAVLSGFGLNAIRSDGELLEESSASFTFVLPSGTCLIVTASNRIIKSIPIQGCGTVRVPPPRCKLKSVLAKLKPPLPKNAPVAVALSPNGTGGALWAITGGDTSANIQDDCP